MSPLPLPPRVRGYLDLPGPTNRSLLFDKGLGTYSDSWGLDGSAKKDFLVSFAGRFNGDLSALRERRSQALAALGAMSVAATSATRLVIGLGLPHSTETGFLLDRLTGCPYLPGSSVKGLMRAAAELVCAGEVAGDLAFWRSESARIFGPEPSASRSAQGRMVFYDAFPEDWPRLEVDIMTPHHSSYYMPKGQLPPPGDWESPVPVPFLTIKADTRFCFYFLSLEKDDRRAKDHRALGQLLPLALEFIGVGGKKSAGYGFFPREDVAAGLALTEETLRRSQPTSSLWKDVVLTWLPNVGHLRATHGGEVAETRSQEASRAISSEILVRIKKGRKPVRGDVFVRHIGGKEYEITEVRPYEPPRT